MHIPQNPFDPSAPAISAGIPMIIGNTTGEQSHSGNDPSLEDISFDELKERLEKKQGGSGTFVKNIEFGTRAGEVVDAYEKYFRRKNLLRYGHY